MRRRSTALALAFLLPLLLFSPLEGAELDIRVHQFACKEGHYSAKFGVINTYTYNPQPLIAFKVIRNEKVLECKSVALDVSPGEDGSKSYEVNFDLPCVQEETASLQYRVFDRRARNRVGPWLGDCPSKEPSPTK